ncbi:hypothetical protein [Anaeroplasma bactoclasticum]|uniref:hypothetical protein n=1 Tax=Anaeroplasma bactoclasticum TaxID=2088 RepID=UPI001B86CAB7|nr:hypothetical protein [Anaeroplasma bactoclasticum]
MIPLKIVIKELDTKEVWDQVLYFRLENYPKISDYEMKCLIDFISYEKMYQRDCPIECEDKELLSFIYKELDNKDWYKDINVPKIIKIPLMNKNYGGYLTDYVSHTTDIESAKSIFKSGKLKAAYLVSDKSVEELQKEKRNAANDPIDYFYYVMFAWGNHFGDSLVMERELKRFPTSLDYKIRFKPGIRFIFKYDKLIHHPNCVFDGVLPLKIKDSVILKDWVYKIIIPKEYYSSLIGYIPQYLFDRIHYVDDKGLDIWDYNKKVYELIMEE